MARSPFGQRSILDYLPDPLQQQPFQQPASTIAGALSNSNTATRNDPQQGTPWMQDTADPWGAFNNTPQMNDNTPQLGGGNQAGDLWGGFNATPQMNDGTTQLGGTPTQQAASTIAGALPGQSAVAASGGVLANPAGYRLPQGWQAEGNKYSFNVPPTKPGDPGNMLYQMGYDPTRDGAKIPSAQGNRKEFDVVYAYMNEVAKANGIPDIAQAPPDLAAWAINYAVGRLKTDTINAQGQAGWANSAFAGFDRQAAQTATPGQVPVAGQVGTAANSTAAGVTPPATTTTPGATPPAATTAPVTSVNPVTGQTVTATGDSGNNQRNMALISDSDFALNQMMEKIGLAPGSNNAFANAIRNTLKPQLGRYMQLQGLGDGQANYIDNAQNSLNDFSNRVNGGAGLFEGLNQFANQQKQAAFTPGSKFMSSDNPTQMAALSQLTALGTAGMNPLMQAAWKQYFDNASYASQSYDYGQLGPNNNNRSAADWLRNSQWADLLR